MGTTHPMTTTGTHDTAVTTATATGDGGTGHTETPEEVEARIARTRQALASDLDTLQDRVSPSAIVERRKEAARSKVSGLRDKVMGSAHDARSSASGTVHGAAGSAVHGVEQRVEGAPLGAGLVAFGAGLLVAAMMPATEREKQVARQAVDAAQEHGVVDQAKGMAQEVASEVKDSATSAAQEVKASAQESAQTVQEQGKHAAQDVKQDVSSS